MRLLEAAERVFVRKGFDNASVEEISDRAGCPPEAFYSHFENKQQALRAVIELRRPAVMQALDDLFLSVPERDDRIAAVRRAVFKSMAALGLPRGGAIQQFGAPEAGRDGRSAG
jgi:AcrR family transcriptional regulator